MNDAKIVVGTRAATVPFGRNKGRDCSTINELSYSDGSVSFRCTDCEYERDNFLSVMSHRNKHRTVKRQSPGTAKRTKNLKAVQDAIRVISDAVFDSPENQATIDELQRKIARLEQRLAESQKARRKAEGDLNRIKSALR